MILLVLPFFDNILIVNGYVVLGNINIIYACMYLFVTFIFVLVLSQVVANILSCGAM